MQTACSLLTKLQNVISNDNPGLHSCLPHINASLEKLILTCDAACSVVQSSANDLSFSNKEEIAPGKKWSYSLASQPLLIRLDAKERIFYSALTF